MEPEKNEPEKTTFFKIGINLVYFFNEISQTLYRKRNMSWEFIK